MSLLVAVSLAVAVAAAATGTGCGGGSAGGGSGPEAGNGEASAPEGGPSESGPEASAESGVDAQPEASAPCPTPTFSPDSGTVDPGTVTITDPGLPSNGVILYTTNGTNPIQGSLTYTGPIAITQTTTIRAAGFAPSCAESDVAVATYTAGGPPDAGSLASVTFSPTSQKADNDFPLTLTAAAGATICYSLDGSTPTCSGGACSGTSATYVAADQITIDGTVTDPSGSTQGQVTVTAIACAVGSANSPPKAQVYTLKVATPQITGLTNGNNAYAAAGVAGILAEATLDSVSPASPMVVHGVAGATPPTCSDPHVVAVGSKVIGTQVAQEYQAIGCKLGYADSDLAVFDYTFTLDAPGVTGGTFHYPPKLATGSTPGAAVVVDTANAGANDQLCITLDGSLPACGPGTALKGACATGGSTAALNANTVGNATSASTTVRVVACAPTGVLSSSDAKDTFTLQYEPLFVSTAAATPPTGAPGWDATKSLAITTSFSIPAAAGTNPYGPLEIFPTQNPGGGTTAGTCSKDDTQGGPTCTNSPAFTLPDFVCWAKDAAAVCPANPTGAAACDTTHGGGLAVTTAGAALPAVGDVLGGDSISVVGCQATGTPPYVFASSATTVAFSASGQALAPGVSAPTSTPYLSQATVTLTNNDPNKVTLCYTYANPPVQPTCTSGATSTCGGAGVQTAVLSAKGAAGSSLTLYPGPTATPGLVQIDNASLTAVVCNQSEGQSPGMAQSYAFRGAEPDFGTSQNGTDLDSTTTVTVGEVIYVSSTSNYDLSAGSSPFEIFIRTDGTSATCGDANAQVATLVVGESSAGPPPVLTNTWSNDSITVAKKPITISAVACGQLNGTTSYLQQASAVRTIKFN